MYKSGEKGIYLILAAVFSLLLLSLCALALGLGFLHTNKARQQAIGNLVVLGAVDEYLKFDQGESITEQARRAASLSRANDLLAQNPVPGMKQNENYLLGTKNNPGPAGILRFGRYHNIEPGGGHTTSCDEYPCWEEVDATSGANSIRLELANTEHAITAPFTRILGQDNFIIREDSTVTVVETCGAYLLDVSLSTVSQSHKFRYNFNYKVPSGMPYGPIPQDATLYAYLTDFIGPYQAPSEYPLCGEPVLGEPTNSHILWCNVVGYEQEFENGAAVYKRDASNNLIPILDNSGNHLKNPDFHWEDYIPVQASFGHDGSEGAQVFDLMVHHNPDIPPEPMRSFYLAINAGLRLVNQNQTVADRAMFRAFTGDVYERKYPYVGVTTTDLGDLIDLTNMNNFPGEEINFATQGWLPIVNPGDDTFSGTGHVKVLQQTAQDLINNCPAGSKKFIVLATDGVSTCRYRDPDWAVPSNDGFPVPHPLPDQTGQDFCIGGPHGWYLYWESENRLLTDVLDTLTENKIALTVVMDGETSYPHYRNMPHPDYDPNLCRHDTDNESPCFLDFTEAQEHGLQGMPNPPASFSDWDPDTGPAECGADLENSYFYTCLNTYTDPFANDGGGETYPSASAQDAFEARSWFYPNVKFSRPMGVFGHMAMTSGGTLCPLLAPTVTNHNANSLYVDPEDVNRPCALEDFGNGLTPCRLRNSERDTSNNGVEFRPLEYMDKGTQAAKCVLDAIGANRYLHVEPREVNYESQEASAPPSSPR